MDFKNSNRNNLFYREYIFILTCLTCLIRRRYPLRFNGFLKLGSKLGSKHKQKSIEADI